MAGIARGHFESRDMSAKFRVRNQMSDFLFSSYYN